MKHLLLIITVPLGLVAVIFTVANLKPVSIDLWPLTVQVEVWLSVIVLLSLLVGFLVGGTVAWITAGRHRRRARRAERQALQLVEENRRLRAVVSAPRQTPPPPAKSVLPAA